MPALAALAGAGAAWGLFESQWVECRELDVPVRGLPPALEGLRVLHLSDFHLGSVSLNGRALAKAVDWATTRKPDLIAITGDLLSTQRGEPDLRASIRRLAARHGIFVVLGNHDVAVTRDPFSTAREVDDLTDAGAVLLRDESASFSISGLRLQVVGSDPRSYLAGRARPAHLVDPEADLRILLCHYPQIVDGLSPGSFQLVLAGHVHGGQICVPYPGGKIRFGEFSPPYPQGIYELGRSTLVVSRGTGTGFVPFRFFARPEAAELVLRGVP